MGMRKAAAIRAFFFFPKDLAGEQTGRSENQTVLLICHCSAM